MTFVDLGILILRVVLGSIFIAHGTQKLFGWFGGHGMEGTQGFIGKLGLKPEKFWANVAALAETLGGLGIFFGLLTPFAAAAVIGVMLMAIIKVHWQNGFFNTQGGMEYNLINIAVAFAIGLFGPGFFSLDAALNIAYPLPISFLITLGIVILGVLFAIFGIPAIREFSEQSHAGD
jgi:putative oxidoreductase